MRLLDHDEEAEGALRTLGADPPYCFAVSAAWRSGEVDLVPLLGGPEDHNPRREGLKKAVEQILEAAERQGRRRFPPPQSGSHRILTLAPLWELPAKMRHRLVLGAVLERGDAPKGLIEDLVALEEGRLRLDNRSFAPLARALDRGRQAEPPDPEEAVLVRFFDGRRLREIPANLTKRRVVLRRLTREFDGDTPYTQREVNRILNAFHPDHAALRRYLVDEGFLTREEGVYRVAAASED